jgi:hypothetical protein
VHFTDTYMHPCMIDSCKSLYVCTSMKSYICIYMYICMCVCVCLCVCVCVCVCVRAYEITLGRADSVRTSGRA